MDNLFNSQTVPVTKADIENAGLDSSNCINAQHIRDNSITAELLNSLYQGIPHSKRNGYNGCYTSNDPDAYEVDTSIKVTNSDGTDISYILYTSDIAHLKTTPFNKLLKNMVNSLLLTVLIAIIICASSFWLNYSNCITINAEGECNVYLGEEQGSPVKLIDYLFPSNLWNWPYNECENKLSGGSMNYDEKNIRVDESNSNECKATDLDETAKNSNVFPYSFLRNLEDDYKDYHVLKVIPKYSLTLVLCVMLVYRKIVKLIINKGISINKSLNGNPLGKLLIIILSILSFTTILGLINNFIIPVVSLLLLAVILLMHLLDLGSIIRANIKKQESKTKLVSTFCVGAIITGILMLIFHLGDIKEGDDGLGIYAAAFIFYWGFTFFGRLVAGTCLFILCAILAVVITNIMRAKAAKEAEEFYTPIFEKNQDWFKYNNITTNGVTFVTPATSLQRNHRDNFVFSQSKGKQKNQKYQKYQALNFRITKNKPLEGERLDAYIYTNDDNDTLNDSSMVQYFNTIRTTYVMDAKDKNVDIEWLKEE